jgi:hypothetical protein
MGTRHDETCQVWVCRRGEAGRVAPARGVYPELVDGLGDFVRGRMRESEGQIEGLFESLLSESFGES